jgi:hypothetical protein
MPKLQRVFRLGDFVGPSEAFKLRIPAGEDFIVRLVGCRGPSTAVTFLSSASKNGGLRAFAGRRIEIELIGTNADRWRRRVAAEKQANKIRANQKRSGAGLNVEPRREDR